MNALRKIWPSKAPEGPALRVVGLTNDRRSKDQLSSYSAIEQERADMAVEKKWRENVRQNEIRRLEQKLLERVDAELLDPDPEFNDWRDATSFDAGIPRQGEI